VSVGHIARAVEAQGIATVIVAIQAFEAELSAMRVPRLVTTPFPMGRPVGAPHDVSGQLETMSRALALLQSATPQDRLLRVAGRYQPQPAPR